MLQIHLAEHVTHLQRAVQIGRRVGHDLIDGSGAIVVGEDDPKLAIAAG